MLKYLRHHFASAASLLAFGGLVVGLAMVGRSISDIASAGPSTGLLAVLGEGIDEFDIRFGALGPQLTSVFSDANTWVGIAALAATAVTVVSAFRQVSEWIHGPADASALAEHAVQRATDALGVRPTRVSWGVVRDADTGRPLPFARVHALDEKGSVIARVIADAQGRYGFHSSADTMYERGGVGSLHAQKDGYHHHIDAHPVTAGVVLRQTDIPMDRHAGTPISSGARSFGVRLVSGAAFWGGVLTLPMVYFAEPGVASGALVALFSVSAIVRAVGSGGRS